MSFLTILLFVFMDWQKFLVKRRSAIFSGIAALIIIGVGFLAFNSLSQTDKTKTPKKGATQTSQKQAPAPPAATQTTPPPAQTKVKNYTVVSGDSLSKIAKAFYNDASKWTLLASANKIATPNLIFRGMVLTIPDISTQSTPTAAVTPTSPPTTTVNQPKTYVVVKGDCLWTISQKFYNGNGYHWVIIRDANPGKVGLLPNGRPLITPGTVLTIPSIPSG